MFLDRKSMITFENILIQSDKKNPQKTDFCTLSKLFNSGLQSDRTFGHFKEKASYWLSMKTDVHMKPSMTP